MNPKITALDMANYLGITVQAVHKKIKSLNLKTSKSLNKTYFGHNIARKIIKEPSSLKKICVSVIKGGVGKTTISEAIAINASLFGLRVLCIDADQQANLTKGLQATEMARNKPVLIDILSNNQNPLNSIIQISEGLDLFPSRLDNVILDNYLMTNRINLSTIFTNLFSHIHHKYDLIIIDCPPTLGSSVCASILYSDILLSPLNPDIYSYEGINIMAKELADLKYQFNSNIEWKILLNKFDTRTVISSEYVEEIMEKPQYQSKILKSIIRLSQEFPNAKKKQKGVFDTLRKSTAKEDILALTKELLT
jgi:chromosome partitioning protein